MLFIFLVVAFNAYFMCAFKWFFGGAVSEYQRKNKKWQERGQKEEKNIVYVCICMPLIFAWRRYLIFWADSEKCLASTGTGTWKTVYTDTMNEIGETTEIDNKANTIQNTI